MPKTTTQKWAVTRQHYWGSDNPYAVEIAGGGMDYTNPDALAAKYDDEFTEHTDPREAVKAALAIAAAWRKDEPDKHIYIAVGHTGGFTMPFEEGTDEAAKHWGEETYKELPKCPCCGKLMGDDRWGPADFTVPEEDKVCSERCFEKHFAYLYTEEEEDSE